MSIERTFDVADCPSFVSRINELRNQLSDPDQPGPLFNGLYMLRPYTTVPQQWLQLRMVAGSNAIVLWIRMDNLYLVAFSQEGQTGRTWEFGQGNDSLIPGSDALRFNGGYTNHNLGEIQTGPIPGVLRRPDLGRQQLVDGIRGLAAYQGNGGAEVRTWLRTMVVTICESIRSHEVCSHIGNLLMQGSSGWLTQRTRRIIKNWKKISICLIQSANDPSIPGLYNKLALICNDTYEARQVVAIVYHGRSSESSNSLGEREKRSVPAVADDVPMGLTFLEVFAVVIVNIDNENPGDLYGTFTVDDGLNPEVLFSRERSKIQSVGPGGLAELTGPNRAIWGYDEVVFTFDLMDADFDPSPDDEISNGPMIWNDETEYNRVNEYEVKAKNGSVKMSYAVITNAVVATVVVVLTNGDGESYPDLYGTMTAASSALPSHKVSLFNTQQTDCIKMKAGDRIPLLRNVVIVPLGSSLKIDADLWDYDTLPSDDHIAKGEAVFDARLTGTANRVISAQYGLVTVHVTWSRT